MAAIGKAESTVQGLRQVIQDLVAPEMRELKAEIRNRMHGLTGWNRSLPPALKGFGGS